ncbi:MAG: SDR family NAD(P)-dependent oxidoreductase [Dehalococcoidia bacterium]|nr:SDR family NAD(P)-dependent oxidoreductase [Dehalococcoidia bacterium]
MAVRCDVTLNEEIETAVQRTLGEFGRLDVLVNNAGILVPGTILEMQARHLDLIYRVNLRGPVVFCRAVIPHMARLGGGHIVNISSRGAIGPGQGPYKEPRTGGTAYGATKAALERFSQGLAAEVFASNIAVNALSPHLLLWSEGGYYFRTLGGGTPSYAGVRMSGEIIGDAAVRICAKAPRAFTGRILYDEPFLLEDGMSQRELMARYPVVSGPSPTNP